MTMMEPDSGGDGTATSRRVCFSENRNHTLPKACVDIRSCAILSDLRSPTLQPMTKRKSETDQGSLEVNGPAVKPLGSWILILIVFF